jgi:hypothetical protein
VNRLCVHVPAAELAAIVSEAGNQPAIVTINEAEHVSSVLLNLALNEKLITRPDDCDVVVNSDQRIVDAFLVRVPPGSRSASAAGRF